MTHVRDQSGARRPPLAGRVDAARRRAFVGREGEKELFRSALDAAHLPFVFLYLHGPAGIGKTALLREFADLALEKGATPVLLDGRDIEPAPESFLRAFSQALGLASDDTPFDALAGRGDRHVVLVDTCERIAPLDPWLHTRFLPALPDDTLLVMAGRHPLAAHWRADLGVRELTRVVALRNLPPDESRVLLSRRGVPQAQHDSVLRFTHGHPLALSLVAELFDQPAGETLRFVPEAAPAVVNTLLERFLEHVPTPVHREALEICAHVRVTTEALLVGVVTESDPHELFEWLRGLAFMELGPAGILPHDLVREVLDTDLRWRNPDAYTRMHRRIRRYFVRRLEEETNAAQRLQTFYSILYLHRHSPFMKPYFDFASLGTLYTEPARPADHDAIVSMAERYEGRASARIVRHWLRRQPEGFLIVRGAGQEPLGYLAHLTLAERREEDAKIDPAIDAVWAYAQRQGGARAGEVIQLERFLIAGESYQEPSPILNTMQIACTMQWLGTPGVAWTFVCYADPERWRPVMSYIDFRRAGEADFVVGSRTFGVYGHDWRTTPPAAWLELTGERELGTDLTLDALEARRAAPLVVLSQPEFDDAVKGALRAYTRPADLQDNPLLRSRLVADVPGDQPPAAKLRTLLRTAADTLKSTARDEKFHRAIAATFFDPATTQEAAAERLGLPFGTYRYQLSVGIERMTAWLWRRELHGPTPD